MSKRVFRVVSVLNYEDLNKCFTWRGGLQKNAKTVRHTSLRSALEEARRAASHEYTAFVVRRNARGWEEVAYCPPLAR